MHGYLFTEEMKFTILNGKLKNVHSLLPIINYYEFKFEMVILYWIV